jgi:hypothetical protein
VGLAAAFVVPRARAYLVPRVLVSRCLPGFYFREHYFIVMLPAVALAAGAGAGWVGRSLFGRSVAAAIAAVAVFAGAAAVLVEGQGDVFFRLGLDQVSRRIYGLNPFPESPAIGRYLAQRTTDRDTIAVIGSEPQIYFYSGRHSATGYIYTWPDQVAALRPADAGQMISEIRPPSRRIVMSACRCRGSSGSRPTRRSRVGDRYTTEHYDVVGQVDIVSTGPVSGTTSPRTISRRVERDHGAAPPRRRRRRRWFTGAAT